MTSIRAWLWQRTTQWLVTERSSAAEPICDFERVGFEIRPCDVLLIEGRSRVSEIIKLITQSAWSHAALYIGRLRDIPDPELQARILAIYPEAGDRQLIIESLLGHGTVVSPLEKYRRFNLRLCRPKGLARIDMLQIVREAISHLGCDYDLRQLLDLARFLLPYSVLPRRWRSSLFGHRIGGSTRTVCSTMLAAAFGAVQFPILPVIQRAADGSVKLFARNIRLCTPRDFDYSPYFAIIKYPLFGYDDRSFYRGLPWDETGRICNDEADCYLPPPLTPVVAELPVAALTATPVATAALMQASAPAAQVRVRPFGDWLRRGGMLLNGWLK